MLRTHPVDEAWSKIFAAAPSAVCRPPLSTDPVSEALRAAGVPEDVVVLAHRIYLREVAHVRLVVREFRELGRGS